MVLGTAVVEVIVWRLVPGLRPALAATTGTDYGKGRCGEAQMGWWSASGVGQSAVALYERMLCEGEVRDSCGDAYEGIGLKGKGRDGDGQDGEEGHTKEDDGEQLL